MSDARKLRIVGGLIVALMTLLTVGAVWLNYWLLTVPSPGRWPLGER